MNVAAVVVAGVLLALTLTALVWVVQYWEDRH